MRRTLFRVASVFFFLFGIFFLFCCLVADLGIIPILLAVFMIVFSVVAFVNPDIGKRDGAVQKASSSSKLDKLEKASADALEYSFDVTGVSNYQKAIREHCLENDDYSMPKKEAIDFGMIDEPIYKYETSFGKVSLIPEPENKYDKNAIKVMRRDDLLGYVPADETEAVHRIISGEYETDARVYAGPYKIIREDDEENYTVEKENQNVGLRVTITYE